MINLIRSIIKKYKLIDAGDKVLVGLSGGADSMCLVHVLCVLADELGISVGAAHINHNIRGAEAESDAMSACEFAKRLGIDFYLGSENVIEYARKNGISEELAGREVRYKFFSKIKEEYGYTKIATAHNRNDNAETLVMNFMRGTTIQGLCGIPIKRGDIIRPLLEVERSDIEKYCATNDISYVTDKTNLETIYTRNKVRLNLLPQIESEFNANFIKTVTKNAQLISDENNYIDNAAIEIYNTYVSSSSILLSVIKREHIALIRRVIMRMISDAIGTVADVSSTAVEDIIRLCESGESGKSINLQGGVVAAIEYGKLVIAKEEDSIGEFEYSLEENKDILINELGVYARLERCNVKERDGAMYFSINELSDIRIRNRRFGDVFCPVGMQGRKKLKNLFIDDKIPRIKRPAIPLITVNGNIACVGTLRTDSAYESEKNSILFKVKLMSIKQEENYIGT